MDGTNGGNHGNERQTKTRSVDSASEGTYYTCAAAAAAAAVVYMLAILVFACILLRIFLPLII